MKERPILFSGEMVRAILDGRKTQTRRVMNPQPTHYCQSDKCWVWKGYSWNEDIHNPDHRIDWRGEECVPFYEGLRLWVRETHAYTDESINDEPGWVYRATDPDWSEMEGFKWKPSIFMPRAASRITLEIESVRVERLRDITEDDAKAEGVEWYPALRPIPLYEDLWESINGKGSWASNPWVWVIGFSKVAIPCFAGQCVNETGKRTGTHEIVHTTTLK